MRIHYWILLTLIGLTVSCSSVNPDYQEAARDPEFFHRSMKKLSDVIVHDIFSPPVASRIYAYSSIAAYEVMVQDEPGYRSLAGQLTELTAAPAPEDGAAYCYPLAAVHAFLTVGKTLVFSEDKMEAFQEEIYAQFDSLRMPSDVYDRSLAYGEAVAGHVLEWSQGDLYKETRTYPKFSLSEDPARWQPTPPDYMDGIEPHWREIRPLVLDSAQQFTPPPPTPFDTDPESRFMKETMEVYEVVAAADPADKEERIAIANFWDCNPYVSHHTGHVMFATKKITPGTGSALPRSPAGKPAPTS